MGRHSTRTPQFMAVPFILVQKWSAAVTDIGKHSHDTWPTSRRNSAGPQMAQDSASRTQADSGISCRKVTTHHYDLSSRDIRTRHTPTPFSSPVQASERAVAGKSVSCSTCGSGVLGDVLYSRSGCPRWQRGPESCRRRLRPHRLPPSDCSRCICPV